MHYPPDYRLTRGWPLGEALKKTDLTGAFCDAETLQLLRICAESGSRREMLNKATDTLDAQLSNQLNTLS